MSDPNWSGGVAKILRDHARGPEPRSELAELRDELAALRAKSRTLETCIVWLLEHHPQLHPKHREDSER